MRSGLWCRSWYLWEKSQAALICSSPAWAAGQGRSPVVPSTYPRSTAGLIDMKLCHIHSVPALKTRSLLAAKIEAGINRSKQLVLTWIWKLIKASPPLVVKTHVRYTLAPHTFSGQNKLNATMLWKALCLLSTWTKLNTRLNISKRNCKPSRSFSWGFFLMLSPKRSNTGRKKVYREDKVRRKK